MPCACVRGFERIGDLLCDGDRFIDRHRSSNQSSGEIFPLDELYHERLDVARVFEPV